MARHERFNRLVRDFVDESGTVAVGIAERDGEFDHRERRFTSTDDVGVYGGNDESEMLFERQQDLRGELKFRRVRAIAAVVLRDTLASRFIEERHIVNVGKNRDRHHRDATQSDVIHKVLASHPANLLNSRNICFVVLILYMCLSVTTVTIVTIVTTVTLSVFYLSGLSEICEIF